MKDSELAELSDIEKKVFKHLQKSRYEDVSTAVDGVSKSLGLRNDEAAEYIFKLWKKGFIEVIEPKPIRNFLTYLSSRESFTYYLTILLIIFTDLIVLFITKPPLVYIRYVLGSLFVLYLPGYALIEALYPRGDELEPLERLALSIGLSLALVPLVGLALNYTPWGIRLEPILYSLTLLTLILISYAYYKKYQYYRSRVTT